MNSIIATQNSSLNSTIVSNPPQHPISSDIIDESEWSPQNGDSFQDFESFEKLLNNYAKKHGFKLSRRSSEALKENSNIKSRIVWQCQYSGHYKQAKTCTSRKTSCQFMVRIAWQRSANCYKVGKVVLEHNHPLHLDDCKSGLESQMNSGLLTPNSPAHIPLSLPRSASSIHLTSLAGIKTEETDEIFRESQYTRRTDNMKTKLERLVPLACQTEDNYLVVMQLLDRILDKIDPQASFFNDSMGSSHTSMTPMLNTMNVGGSGFLPAQPLSGSLVPTSLPAMGASDHFHSKPNSIVDFSTIQMPGPI